MNAGYIARAVAIASLNGLAVSPVSAAPPQIRTAPPPVMQNPNAPRLPLHHPDPQGSPAPPTAQYTALSFKITTGDDDLRTDSASWVTLTFPDNTNQNCALRPENEDTWSNNTTHEAPQCVLTSPRTFDELKAAKIILSYGSAIPSGVMGGAGDFLHTTDNWNVNEVRIEALNAGQFTQRCLIDSTGNPLVRLKASLTSYDLTAAPTTC